MKSFKKILRLLGLILLIVLASLGIGFVGGVPIPPTKKRENTIEIKTELVEDKEDETKLFQFKIKE